VTYIIVNGDYMQSNPNLPTDVICEVDSYRRQSTDIKGVPISNQEVGRFYKDLVAFYQMLPKDRDGELDDDGTARLDQLGTYFNFLSRERGYDFVEKVHAFLKERGMVEGDETLIDRERWIWENRRYDFEKNKGRAPIVRDPPRGDFGLPAQGWHKFGHGWKFGNPNER
jgi:hypothetical protein